MTQQENTASDRITPTGPQDEPLNPQEPRFGQTSRRGMGQEMMMSELPKMAISIMQPWAWLIVNGHKDIENRDWWTRYRGPVLIHAGKKIDKECLADLCGGEHPVTGYPLDQAIFDALAAESPLPFGGIVGAAEIVDCVSESSSPWFVGRHGFVIRNARPLPFMPMRGQLGFFPAEYAEPARSPSQ